jgi:uncharacterized membrane protein
MFRFFKTSFVTGLLILVPLLLLFLMLKELIQLMVVVATPIADLFPMGTFDTEHQTEILAAVLIICTALIIGVLAKIPVSRVVGANIEERTVGKLPFYRMLHTVTSAFLNMEESTSFKPALIHRDSGEMEPAYIIEDHGRPRIVVLVPWSPTAFSGAIKLIPRERVQELPLTLDEFSLSLSNYGLGLSEILYEKQGALKTSLS